MTALPQALIFDVDGTLADTEEAHRTAFNLAFEHAQLGWHWDRPTYRRLLGVTGGKERIAAHLDTLPLSATERESLQASIPQWHAAKTQHYAEMVAEGRVALREGVSRLLDEAGAAGIRLGIATTTTRANVEALLTAQLGAQGLQRFEVIACGDEVRAKKPAPDIYLRVLADLNIQPAQAIALEDSVNGLRSAVAAGLWTLVTPTCWTEGGDFSAAGLVIRNLADLEAAAQMAAGPVGSTLQALAHFWNRPPLIERPENRGSHPPASRAQGDAIRL